MAEWGVSNAAPFQQIIGKLCWLNDKRAKSCPRDQDDWVRPSAETGHIGAVVWGHVFLSDNLAASICCTSAVSLPKAEKPTRFSKDFTARCCAYARASLLPYRVTARREAFKPRAPRHRRSTIYGRNSAGCDLRWSTAGQSTHVLAMTSPVVPGILVSCHRPAEPDERL